jgi:cytochrome P450
VDSSAITGASLDPAPIVAHLRRRNPVCWLAGLDAWLVTRHEDVRCLFSEARLTADARAYARYEPPADARAARWLTAMPFRSTAENEASPGRRLVAAALTPRVAARLEDRVRDVVERFAAPLRGRTGRVDLMAEFAVPVSTTAIGRILGVPPKDRDEARFRQLAVQATAVIRPLLTKEKQRRAEQAAAEMGEYVLGLVRERNSEPRDDLISDLVRASAGAASAEELAAVIAGVVSAGTGTTALAFGRALRTLLHHPDQLALVRRDRRILPNAVEELLRYDSGIVVMPRYVVDDFPLHGQVLRQGQLVLLSLLGANRDPDVFIDPECVDVLRDTREALSFGFGAHYCIGASVARMELRLMLDAALDFLPCGARLREDEIRWSRKGFMSQIKTLPVDFTAPERSPLRQQADE